MASLAVLLSGNEITDAARAAARAWLATQQGGSTDGLPAGSGVGVWWATTNRHPYGQCDSCPAANYAKRSGTDTGSTISQDPATAAPFSPYSCKIVCAGVGLNGPSARTNAGQALAAGTWCCGSIWFSGTPGVTYSVQVGVINTDATITPGTITNFVCQDGSRPTIVAGGKTWELITGIPLQVAAGKTGDKIKIDIFQTVLAAESLWVAHPMLEVPPATAAAPVSSPYVATSGGVTASRAAARVQAPASLLNASQGGAAVFCVPGYGSSGNPNGQTTSVGLLSWLTDANNHLNMELEGTSNLDTLNVYGGVTSFARQSPVWLQGKSIFCASAWDAASIYAAVTGGPFASTAPANRVIPSGSLVDLGSNAGGQVFGGLIKWIIFWTGTPTSSDLAQINGLLVAGSRPTPDTLNRLFPAATVTGVWAAVDATITLPTPSTVARASFNCYVSWEAWNVGLLSFDHSTFDGTDVFAVSPLDATFQGPNDDLSKLFHGYTVTRGRTSNLDQVAAASCMIDIRDPNGTYNPDNPASPLYGQLEDRLHPVKVTATYAGVTYTRFYGWVRRFHWEPQGRRGITQLECVDLFYWLDRARPVIAATGPTTTGAAIGLILDSVGAIDPAMRDLDAGDQIPGFTADGTLSGLDLIAGLLEAERGMFFVAATGKATYRSRASRLTKTSTHTFVDRMVGPSPGVDWDQVYNRVTVQHSTTGHVATASDQTSIGKVGYSDLPEINTAYLSTDAQADALALWLLAQNKDPRPPMRNFGIDSRDDDLLQQQLARELVDRITVQAARGDTSGDFHIDQITETLDGSTGRLTSQYLLSRAGKLNAAQFDGATDFSGAYEFTY